MELLAKLVIGIVAIEHIYIMWLEMFAWETKGKETFKSIPEAIFKPTKGLAANQGLYNGFLAAGLIWSLWSSEVLLQQNLAIFFLSCVGIAGVYGAFTAEKGIFYKQALPALIGIILVLIWKYN